MKSVELKYFFFRFTVILHEGENCRCQRINFSAYIVIYDIKSFDFLPVCPVILIVSTYPAFEEMRNTHELFALQ